MKNIKGKDQQEEKQSPEELTSVETINFNLQNNNNQQAITEELTSNYNSISELLQDEQMFRLDQDPVFDFTTFEDLNNNLQNNITEFEGIVLSEDFIEQPEDIDMFKDLSFAEDLTGKEVYMSSMSPLPAPISPPPNAEKMVKMEDIEDFDLIEYIESTTVSFNRYFLNFKIVYLRFFFFFCFFFF